MHTTPIRQIQAQSRKTETQRSHAPLIHFIRHLALLFFDDSVVPIPQERENSLLISVRDDFSSEILNKKLQACILLNKSNLLNSLIHDKYNLQYFSFESVFIVISEFSMKSSEGIELRISFH